MLTVGIWEAAVVTAKAATYAATLGDAGGVFFLGYSHALLDSRCAARIRRLLRLLACIAVLTGGAIILTTAASMAGDAGGLADVGARRALKRSIMAELVVAGGVLFVTAAMTTLTGPSALE